jgi:gluconolactonase
VISRSSTTALSCSSRRRREWNGSSPGAAGPRARPIFPAARSLVWSDIPNDRILRFDETTGTTGVFRHPAGYANGNVVDREGRLVTCEHGGRRVSRTEHDGAITVIADRFEGKRFNPRTTPW